MREATIEVPLAAALMRSRTPADLEGAVARAAQMISLLAEWADRVTDDEDEDAARAIAALWSALQGRRDAETDQIIAVVAAVRDGAEAFRHGGFPLADAGELARTLLGRYYPETAKRLDGAALAGVVEGWPVNGQGRLHWDLVATLLPTLGIEASPEAIRKAVTRWDSAVANVKR